jgi:hypothetical protein
MTAIKSQNRQEKLDWVITFAALGLIVLICVGFYIYKHPNIISTPATPQKNIEYTL